MVMLARLPGRVSLFKSETSRNSMDPMYPSDDSWL